MTRQRAFIAALPLLTAVACSDFATAPDRVPADFSMTPDTAVVTAGETVTFEYTVLDEAGDTYDALPSWAAPLWTYSRESILDVDPAGRGRALEAGEVLATARFAGMEAEALVRVNPTELTVSVLFDHITQGVQRRGGDVPLVAGRDGLLRVYVSGDGPNFFSPSVRAIFYRDGSVVHTDTLALESSGLPRTLREGDLERSYDVMVPGSVLQPGTSLALEVDPEGVVPASSSSVLRVPATGEAALDIAEVPPFRIRLVPVTLSLTGTTSSFTTENARSRLQLAEDVFPFAELDVDVRAPYTTDLDLGTQEGWRQLLEDITTLRLDDASPRYYYGGFRPPLDSPFLGLGWVGYPVAIGVDYRRGTIAHELGHTLNLPHAPCGNPLNPDPNFPYASGGVGQFGYDRTNDRMRDPNQTYDLMTYCDPVWISDYNYERVIAYRDTSTHDAAFESAAADRAAREDVLIVHGGVHDGVLRLSPALAATAPAYLPPRGERYTLEGLDSDGALLFALPVEPRPLDHGNSSLFSAAIPAELARPDRLATLRLTGPEGVVERSRVAGPAAPPRVALEEEPGQRPGARTVRWDAAAYPLVVVRDGATGRIVAMSRSGELTLPGDAAGLRVAASDGIGTHPVELER